MFITKIYAYVNTHTHMYIPTLFYVLMFVGPVMNRTHIYLQLHGLITKLNHIYIHTHYLENLLYPHWP